jgi:hypothetical protein
MMIAPIGLRLPFVDCTSWRFNGAIGVPQQHSADDWQREASDFRSQI